MTPERRAAIEAMFDANDQIVRNRALDEAARVAANYDASQHSMPSVALNAADAIKAQILELKSKP